MNNEQNFNDKEIDEKLKQLAGAHCIKNIDKEFVLQS
jgi:hypothetical protein